MIGRGDEELLNREIDGENMPEESAALRERLARDPEMQARHGRLRELARMLATVKAAEPPPRLAEEVLRMINRSQRERLQRGSWLDALGAAFGRTPVLRYAYTFASGLAVGVVLLAFLGPTSTPTGSDRSLLSGTVLPESRRDQLRLIDQKDFIVGRTRGSATTKRSGGLIVTEIELSGAAPVDVALEFDHNLFTLLAFERSGWTANGISASATDLRFRHLGAGRYAAVLGVKEGRLPPLRLVLEGGEGRLERTLATGREGP